MGFLTGIISGALGWIVVMIFGVMLVLTLWKDFATNRPGRQLSQTYNSAQKKALGIQYNKNEFII